MIYYSLPNNVLKIILNFLDFDQLLVMRSMSPRFGSIIDKMVEEKPLWIKKVDENSNYLRFFCLNRTYCNSQLNVSHSPLLVRLSESIHLKITKLVVYNPFVLSSMHLDNLTHLEIKNNRMVVKDDEEEESKEDDSDRDERSVLVNLRFKKLRTLCLTIRSDVNFLVEAENLFQLKALYNLDKVTVLQPTTVKTLCCHELTDQVTEFKSISKLLIDKFIYRKNQQTNIVKQLSKLRELQISNTNRATFEKLIEQQELNPKLKIFYKNISVDDELSGVQFDFDAVHEINAVSLNTSHYSTYLSYAGTLKGELKQTSLFLNDQLEADSFDLLSKFVNLRCLHVETEAIRFDDWIQILSRLRLTKLYLSREYEQAFLDVLPKLCGHLNCLLIKSNENLDFLFELKHLERITLPDLQSVELFRDLLENLAHLRTVRFNVKVNTCYRCEITRNMVSFNKNTKKVFSEARSTFLSKTLAELSSWSQLFGMNENAIADFDKNIGL